MKKNLIVSLIVFLWVTSLVVVWGQGNTITLAPGENIQIVCQNSIPTPTVSHTLTQTPTKTPRPTSTSTSTPTSTKTPISTPTATSIPTPIITPTGTSCETRATWLNPEAFSSDSARAQTLSKITAAKLNTVFLAVPPVGNNYGWSDLISFGKMLTASINSGYSTNIWVANRWRNSYNGNPDFTSMVEQDAQVAWIKAVLDKYPTASGIHFDYIRYNSWADINATKMTGVTAVVTKTAKMMAQYYPNKKFTAAIFGDTPQYANWSRESVPQWYRNWFSENPGNLYSGFSWGNGVPLFMKYQQDPMSWVGNGMDAVVPMQYTLDDTTWQKEIAYIAPLLSYVGKSNFNLIMGIGWLSPESDNPDWGYDAPGVGRKIVYGRSQGISGYSIFQIGESGVDDGELVNTLSEVNKTTTVSCLR